MALGSALFKGANWSGRSKDWLYTGLEIWCALSQYNLLGHWVLIFIFLRTFEAFGGKIISLAAVYFLAVCIRPSADTRTRIRWRNLWINYQQQDRSKWYPGRVNTFKFCTIFETGPVYYDFWLYFLWFGHFFNQHREHDTHERIYKLLLQQNEIRWLQKGGCITGLSLFASRNEIEHWAAELRRAWRLKAAPESLQTLMDVCNRSCLNSFFFWSHVWSSTFWLSQFLRRHFCAQVINLTLYYCLQNFLSNSNKVSGLNP